MFGCRMIIQTGRRRRWGGGGRRFFGWFGRRGGCGRGGGMGCGCGGRGGGGGGAVGVCWGGARLVEGAGGGCVWVETLIQYLLLDKTYAERGGFEGAKYVMSPPLRDVRNQNVMWNALASGIVSTVATDHAPFDFGAQKQPMGKDDFTKIPNGIP